MCNNKCSNQIKEKEFSQKIIQRIDFIKEYLSNGGDLKIIENYYNSTGSYIGIEEYIKGFDKNK